MSWVEELDRLGPAGVGVLETSESEILDVDAFLSSLNLNADDLVCRAEGIHKCSIKVTHRGVSLCGMDVPMCEVATRNTLKWMVSEHEKCRNCGRFCSVDWKVLPI